MSDNRIGIDVGGTFTDLVLLRDGHVVTRKVRSTPSDFSQGVLAGLRDTLDAEEVSADSLSEVVHGTTVVSNTVIEKKGARTGLITTKGFRDILEIARLTSPRRFDMSWEKPRPLVERALRVEVTERITSSGEVFVPLDLGDVERALAHLIRNDVTSIAICYINSYANPQHEIATAELVRRKAPDVSVSISSELLPEVKEFERTSTTVINAYVNPLMKGYVGGLESGLQAMGVTAPLLVMQSNGGITTAPLAAERPIHCAESGPAAGVIGVLKLGEMIGERDLVSFDMGGTTAKAAIIHGGQPEFCGEFEIGGDSTGGWRFVRGGGYLLRLPAIDIAEVGSGGGSIASIDAGGVLHVGPQSAGAVPGPVCYDAGGTEPTITDANVVLGYFSPDHLVGGDLRLDSSKAAEVMEERIATPMGLPLAEAAWGIQAVANARMQQAIRAVTTERGRDPARYTLVAYGGCGPAHAALIAQQLGIAEVIVPPAPGVFSSFGLLFADIEHHYVQTYWRDVEAIDPDDLTATLEEMRAEARDTLAREGFAGQSVRLDLNAEMRYAGQGHDLSVPITEARVDSRAIEELTAAFSREHEQAFGYRSDETVQLFRVRLVARGVPDTPRVPAEIGLVDGHGAASTSGNREAYFGPDLGWRDCEILAGRRGLRDRTSPGPLIVEEYDATTVVPPGAAAVLDDWGNIRISTGV